MNILVLNAGSSSLKYQFFDMKKNVVLVKGVIERVGVKGSPIKNHTIALKLILDRLVDMGYSLSNIDGVGHRVVHGGEYFKHSVVINTQVIKKICKCNDLAPLHNPVNLEVILACKALLPKVKQVAVFDTAFHQSMEPAHYLYALPYSYYQKYNIRRYGFHGMSHKYVYEVFMKMGKLPTNNPRVITCHVGNGISITAIENGKVVETSMGMTPLEGPIMGTRSGTIDPAIILYLMKHHNMNIQEIDDLLNKKSGLLGVSGMSSDIRDIIAGMQKGKKKCILAIEMFINSLAKYIGAYVAILGGVDAIVLTAGIMEHRAIVRKYVVNKLSYLGIKLNNKANVDDISTPTIISTSDSKVVIAVIPTNEEYMIAKETYQLLNNKK